MGYPMTFRRFVNRNLLAEGDYGSDPLGARTNTKLYEGWDERRLRFDDGVDLEGVLLQTLKTVSQSLESEYGRRSALLGDLRRLERDAVDEKATCEAIARRSGIDVEIVAMVLKEFISW